MSIQKFTLALADFNFPLISKMRGISVVIPTRLDQEIESPQPYWIENIMPVSRGITSVSYLTEISSFANTAITSVPEYGQGILNDSNVHILITEEGTATYYLVTPIYHFIYNTKTSAWEEVEDLISLGSAQTKTSTFFYKGRTILFNDGLGFFSYNYDPVSGFSKVAEVTNGITVGDIRGATVGGSYVILVDGDTVYWNSPISGNSAGATIEFDPNNLTLTGAGSTKILGLKGTINLVVSKPNGFYIYTNLNAVEATFTNNTANPWFFQEIKNSSGCFRKELITYANNAGLHFVWSDNGLVSTQNGQAQQIFPQVTELLTGTLWEYWNAVSKTLIQEYNVAIETKLSFVAGRYLCVSYGKKGQIKEYILVYDIALNRWGKLKVAHLDVFDSNPPKPTLDPSKTWAQNFATPWNTFTNVPWFNYFAGTAEATFRANKIAILSSDFEVLIADFSDQSKETNTDEGLLLYGGVALTRRRLSEANLVEVAGIYPATGIEVEIKTADTSGDTWNPTFYDNVTDDYKVQSVGREHEIKLKGDFVLSTIVVSVKQLGSD